MTEKHDCGVDVPLAPSSEFVAAAIRTALACLREVQAEPSPTKRYFSIPQVVERLEKALAAAGVVEGYGETFCTEKSKP